MDFSKVKSAEDKTKFSVKKKAKWSHSFMNKVYKKIDDTHRQERLPYFHIQEVNSEGRL